MEDEKICMTLLNVIFIYNDDATGGNKCKNHPSMKKSNMMKSVFKCVELNAR
jgi:hypothetical protein